jgi:hypothetical protein
MATVYTQLPADAQIRGPSLVGPGLQIRGPGMLTGQCPTAVTDFSAKVSDAIALNQGPVCILMADDNVAIQQLMARWAVGSGPGWLVGTQTNAAELQRAYDAVGDGKPLRVLIAPTFQYVLALNTKWHACP